MGLPRKWDPILQAKKQTKLNGRSGSWHRFREQLRLSRGVFACEQCKAIVDYLEAHHIVRVQDDPAREYDPRNIRFLCLACHHAVHK